MKTLTNLTAQPGPAQPAPEQPRLSVIVEAAPRVFITLTTGPEGLAIRRTQTQGVFLPLAELVKLAASFEPGILRPSPPPEVEAGAAPSKPAANVHN